MHELEDLDISPFIFMVYINVVGNHLSSMALWLNTKQFYGLYKY